MKVLVACEYSGTVRDAFIAAGHDAMSCDLLPTESAGPHYQGDVMDIIKDGWDLLIGHPPCTYLSFAGEGYFNVERYGKKALRRWDKRIAAMRFFMKLYAAPIKHICLENPKGFPMSAFRKPDQIIQPYFFGDSHIKTTCLWLKNTPPLYYQKDLFNMEETIIAKPEPIYIDKSGKARHFTDAIGGYHGEGASFKKRSKTFQGIADAMAKQWSNLI